VKSAVLEGVKCDEPVVMIDGEPCADEVGDVVVV
jgi:hypothetical protein